MKKVVLQTKGLTKRFGTLTAVHDLSLSVYEGEVFGFLGPNGAGKTTSINMMCGLLPPDAGEVLIFGQSMTGSSAEIRARVGVCPQDIVLWQRLTCLEQLQFVGQMYDISGKEARRRGEQLLVDLDLEKKKHKQVRTLSGGMKRRLNLALALVHNPDIVVLDEPEAGLDPQSRVKVREYIQSLARSKTIILTTHNMDEAERLADRVAIIDNGRLLVLDSPQMLKQQAGKGDVLEMRLSDKLTVEESARITTAAAPLVSTILVDDSQRQLTVRVPDAVSVLPQLLQTLAQINCRPEDVRLRATTLEDVFIHLTGRRLRE